MKIPPIPEHWSPPEALAVFEFVDDLRDRIWDCYGSRIQAWEAADRVADADPDQLDLFDTDAALPF
jgi:hypothetical protein